MIDWRSFFILTTFAVLPHDLRVWMVKLEWTFSIDTPLTMTIWSLVLQRTSKHTRESGSK